MTDEYHTRVAEILDEASDESETLLTPEETADDTEHNLIEVAREADELVASSEPTELLEAVGLGTLPDGSETESVSEAIAKGDPERIEDLHRLLRLAKLGDRSDEEQLEDATGGIRETIRQAQSETDDTMTEDTDQDEAEQESTADDESEGEAEEGNGGDAGDLGDRLRTAMSSSFEGFGGEIGKIQEQLEGATTDDEDDVDEVEETDKEEADEENDKDDDGLLGLGDGDDGDGGGRLGSGGSFRHSTMAPPPSERADMHAVKRHSTMPKRNK